MIIPINNYLLIELIPEDTGGIVGVDKGNSQKGIILDIGEKVEAPLAKGNVVYFQKYAEADLTIEDKGKTLTVIEDKEVRAKDATGK